MNFIKNISVVEQSCQQFVEPHPCYYNFTSQIIPLIAHHQNLILDHSVISVAQNQPQSNCIKLHFIKNRSNLDTCIIYLHGLASYCLEGRFIVPLLGHNFSLCLFDSRGHGLNSAKYVTYGLLQANQLLQVIQAVADRGYKNIVLWGRSMGAVTCLRVMDQFSNHPVIQQVKYVVADSPFSSFKKIAADIVTKMTNLPTFITGILADAFALKIAEKYSVDLRTICLQSSSSLVATTLLYSSCDELMGSQHIQAVANGLHGQKQLIDTFVRHNEQRPQWILQKVMQNIKDKIRKEDSVIHRSQIKRRGLSITKISNQIPSHVQTPLATSFRANDPRKSVKLKLHRKLGVSNLQNPFKQNIQSKNKWEFRNNAKQSCIATFSNCPSAELGGKKLTRCNKDILPAYTSKNVKVDSFFDFN